MSAASVGLTRDRWGIGHAVADDTAGAFWAQGWLAASDRLWQMEWDRRRALGRWAEVAGASAVPEDRFFRRLDLASVARADWDGLRPTTKAMTEAYAAGVNAWLDAGQELPPEFEHHPGPPTRWEPWHCVAVYKVRHIFMGTFHRKLWRGYVAANPAAGPEVAAAMMDDPGVDSAMFGPEAGGGLTLDLLAGSAATLARAGEELAGVAEFDGGSNSWAVDGSMTESGKPLLAGDPHRGIEFPNVYYQCHIACDAFDVIGLAFPGVPGFPHFGHNERVAWCITHGMADDTDVFIETEPVAVERTETIEVLDADPVEVSCARSPRGPVVLGTPEDGSSLSMMWTGLWGADTTFDALLPMLLAGSVDELEEAVRPWVIPVNNVLSADVDGDISLRLRGRVVERPVANRWVPVPATDEHGWDGLASVAFDDLHRWRNPTRAYLVTANNRTGDRGPYISLDFAGPARHDRIVELLDGRSDLTVDDMRAVHADTVSSVGPKVVGRLVNVEPSTPGGREALGLLRAWDHDVTADSAAATIHANLRLRWADEVVARLGVGRPHVGERGWPQLGHVSRMAFEAASTLLLGDGWQLVPGLATAPERDALLGRLLDDVAADLGERLGPDAAGWQWERAHTMVSPHPLALARPTLEELHPPADGTAGDGDTVRAASVGIATDDRIAGSSVARYVFDLANWDRSGWVVPHGVSGVRRSGHDLDQRSTWLTCDLLPMAYSAAAVAEVAVSAEDLAVE